MELSVEWFSIDSRELKSIAHSHLRDLPAGFNDAGQQALVSHFPQHMPRNAKVAVIASGATGQPAAVADPIRSAVARQLLDLPVNFQPFLLR